MKYRHLEYVIEKRGAGSLYYGSIRKENGQFYMIAKGSSYELCEKAVEKAINKRFNELLGIANYK